MDEFKNKVVNADAQTLYKSLCWHIEHYDPMNAEICERLETIRGEVMKRLEKGKD